MFRLEAVWLFPPGRRRHGTETQKAETESVTRETKEAGKRLGVGCPRGRDKGPSGRETGPGMRGAGVWAMQG